MRLRLAFTLLSAEEFHGFVQLSLLFASLEELLYLLDAGLLLVFLPLTAFIDWKEIL